MYLRLDRRAPRRYTWGLFVFLNGLKSRLTQAFAASILDRPGPNLSAYRFL